MFFIQTAYGQEMINRHGEDHDWRNTHIDPLTIYASGGGKDHKRRDFFIDICFVDASKGRYSKPNALTHFCRYQIFDRMINSKQVRAKILATSWWSILLLLDKVFILLLIFSNSKFGILCGLQSVRLTQWINKH